MLVLNANLDITLQTKDFVMIKIAIKVQTVAVFGVPIIISSDHMDFVSNQLSDAWTGMIH
jgi:hypothetical protein